MSLAEYLEGLEDIEDYGEMRAAEESAISEYCNTHTLTTADVILLVARGYDPAEILKTRQ